MSVGVPGLAAGGPGAGGRDAAARPVRHEGDGAHGAGRRRQEAAAAGPRLDQHQQAAGQTRIHFFTFCNAKNFLQINFTDP